MCKPSCSDSTSKIVITKEDISPKGTSCLLLGNDPNIIEYSTGHAPVGTIVEIFYAK
jgi:hypothetical protein